MAKRLELTNWTFDGVPVETIDLDKYEGFCYLVTDTKTNKKYIGKKTVRKAIKTKVGRKTVITYVESDWKKYKTSNPDLRKHIISDPSHIKAEILSFHSTKKDLNIAEIRWMFLFNVLRDESFINDNIAGRYYSAWYENEPIELINPSVMDKWIIKNV